MNTKTWNVEILLYENGDETTRAEAVLQTSTGEVRSAGIARCSPADRAVPEIGDELAVCRALSVLAHDLLEATVADVETNTEERDVGIHT